VLLPDHILASSWQPPRPYKGLNSVLSHSHTIPLSLSSTLDRHPICPAPDIYPISLSCYTSLSLVYFGPPTHLPLARFLAYRLSFPIGQPSPLDSYITAILSLQAHSSLMMEAVHTSETSVDNYFTPSRHFELALYADDTALIATSRSPLLLVRYLETYLNRLELWLRDLGIAINVSKSTAVLFTKTTRHVQRPRPPQLFGESIQWAESARYRGVTLDTWLTWSAHINQVRRKAAQRLCLLSPLLNRSGLSIRNGILLHKQLIHPMLDYACPTDLEVRCPHTH
jgi:hypothetical protein